MLDEIESAFDWSPDRGVETGRAGSRRASLGFRCVNSTRLVVLQPAPGTTDGDALLRWGAGAWSLTLGVDDLDATVDDLRRHAVSFFEPVSDFDRPSRVVRVDHAVVPGAVFDLVDARETTAGVTC